MAARARWLLLEAGQSGSAPRPSGCETGNDFECWTAYRITAPLTFTCRCRHSDIGTMTVSSRGRDVRAHESGDSVDGSAATGAQAARWVAPTLSPHGYGDTISAGSHDDLVRRAPATMDQRGERRERDGARARQHLLGTRRRVARRGPSCCWITGRARTPCPLQGDDLGRGGRSTRPAGRGGLPIPTPPGQRARDAARVDTEARQFDDVVLTFGGCEASRCAAWPDTPNPRLFAMFCPALRLAR